jgi:hypothetical protein
MMIQIPIVNRTQYLNEQIFLYLEKGAPKNPRRKLSTKTQARSITVFLTELLAKNGTKAKNTQKGFTDIEFDRFGAESEQDSHSSGWLQPFMLEYAG